MRLVWLVLISALCCSGWSSTTRVKDEQRTAFFGEDVHVPLPALGGTEVFFRPRLEPLSERVLLRDGALQDPRAKLNALISHLILEDVREEDEGTYVVKSAAEVRRIVLIVRDCALETVVKYGDTFHIPVPPSIGSYALEFRAGVQTHINHTSEEPAVLLVNRSGSPAHGYETRLSAGEKRVNLHAVTGADEGSYTVVDGDGKVRMRACLNVKEHQVFTRLKNGETLKIKLHTDQSRVRLVYVPDSDHRERVLVEQGMLVSPLDAALDGRVSVEGSVFYLKKVSVPDTGVFRVTDLSGFHVANVYLHVEPYKLPPLSVAVLSLVCLLAVLLLVCLLSCLIKVHRRAERARKLTLIAEQAGKGDGDAFRQVVHEAYTRFTEESTAQSTYENNTQSTDLQTKGPEVCKPGQYLALESDRNFLETNDSVVEFSVSALPQDSDTDAPEATPSHAAHAPEDQPETPEGKAGVVETSGDAALLLDQDAVDLRSGTTT